MIEKFIIIQSDEIVNLKFDFVASNIQFHHFNIINGQKRMN